MACQIQWVEVFKNDRDAKSFPDRDGASDDVVLDWVKRINVPCIKDFPYWHIDRRCVVPIGSEVILDVDKVMGKYAKINIKISTQKTNAHTVFFLLYYQYALAYSKALLD